MKSISAILVFYFGVLVVQPTVAEVCLAMQEETCCMESCEVSSCEEGDSQGCPDEAAGKCCMSGVCNPCAMCYCCFGATVEKTNFYFQNSSGDSKLIFNQNISTLSGFLTSPFQPPEFI